MSNCLSFRHVPQSANESSDLKHQVDRLQALVDALSRNSGSQPTVASPNVAAAKSTGLPKHFNAESSLASSPVNSVIEAESVPGDLNLKSLDICEALGQLTVSGIIRIEAQPQSRAPIIPEVICAFAHQGSALMNTCALGKGLPRSHRSCSGRCRSHGHFSVL
jgi:hypothetical protein